MLPPSQFPIRPPTGGMPGMPGMMPKEEAPTTIDNLESVIDYSNLECLNLDPSTPPTNALKQDNETLVIKSDTDPQILFNIPFVSTVRLHHLRIKAKNDGTGPTIVKVFANRATMGFSDAESQTPDQQFTLTAKDYTSDIGLKYVKFQHVDRVSIFIEDNQGEPQTVIQKLELWGCPAKGTNLKEFSKIQDKMLQQS